MSSFPIATAHLIASDLARLSGLPWVADFRDPMAQDEYPKNATEWASYRKVEELTVRQSAALTFTTPGARDYYLARYGESLSARAHIVANGYEENVFASLPTPTRRHDDGVLVLLHSGLLYPWERNPLPFLRALGRLGQAGFWRTHPTRFVFRGSGHDEHFLQVISDLGLNDLVEFRPRIDYRSALVEMLSADALLLFQARNSNFQIPAKTYEYLRTGRPLLAIVDPAGDTATLLRDHRHCEIVDIEAESAIRHSLERFIPRLAGGGFPPADAAVVARHSRQAAAGELARILDRAIAT
jgi:glycosyltransferase involved in cell wall biosynthesis